MGGVDDLKPATWDRLHLYDFRSSHAAEPIETRRLRLRVALVERMLADAGFDGACELKERADYWGLSAISVPAYFVASDGDRSRDPSALSLVRDAVGLSVLADGNADPICRATDPAWVRFGRTAMWLVVMYSFWLALVTGWGAWLFAVFLVIGVIASARSTRTRLRLARHQAREGHCPDCGYDLTGLPDAIGPERTGGIRSGPRACPECGAGWPLIPPPVPVRPGAGLPR